MHLSLILRGRKDKLLNFDSFSFPYIHLKKSIQMKCQRMLLVALVMVSIEPEQSISCINSS